MAYTRGPWHRSKSGQYIRYRIGEVAPNICDMSVHGGPPEEVRDTAVLIKYAPDLLEACKKVLEMLADWEDSEHILPETSILAAVIEKAEGRTS